MCIRDRLARDGLVLQWQDLNADYRTGTGQRRALTLTDGTRVDLDTRSAIALRYDCLLYTSRCV